MCIIMPKCSFCEYLIQEQNDDSSTTYSCKAFPDGIPEEYMFKKEQVRGEICNNDIKFKQKRTEYFDEILNKFLKEFND